MMIRRLLFALLALSLSAAGCGPEGETDDDAGFPPIETADAGDSSDAGPDADANADGGDTDAADPRVPIPEAGPYNVGYMEFEVTYQGRQDGTDEERELNVSVWYPTNAEEGSNARYLDGALSQEEFSDMKAYDEAEPADIGEMPLLVFSHGNGGIAEQNFFMTELWATRGWVIVSPDHTGNTIKSGASINLEAAIYRPQDITAVLDHVYSLPDEHPLSGRVSEEKVAMSGHSFGGYTTLASSGASYAVDDLRSQCDSGTINEDYCKVFDKGMRPKMFKEGFYDDRIKVAIPQTPAGALIFQEGLADIQIPTMLMTGGQDQTLPNAEEGDPIWQMMKGSEHRRLNLPRGGHFTFSNMCDLFGTIEQVKNDGCGENFVETQKAYDIINTYSLAFVRYHLFDDMTAKEIIDGSRYPEGMGELELSVGAD